LQPSRDGALVDLIDRILVKGVILHADLIISVSNVPLIGINLKAAIAGLTTMMDYGIMETWDEKIRKSVLAESEEEAPLAEDERILLKTLGSHYYHKSSRSGIWRSGYLYLTNKRLFLFRKKPAKVLFETTIDKIEMLSTDVEEHLSDGKQATIFLLKTDNEDNGFEKLRTEEVNLLKSKLEERMRNPSLPC
jgi:uncharacterized membrane protein